MKWQDAKRIPLTELLAKLGHEETHRTAGGRQVWYASPFRSEGRPSFNVNVQKNLWNDLGLGEGGTVIDFVLRYYDLPGVSEALRKLDDLGYGDKPASLFEPSAPPYPARAERAQVAATALASPTNLSISEISDVVIQPIADRRLVHYLGERRIPLNVARPYVQEMHYIRNGKPYVSLAFPHVEREGRPQGYELRNKYFQAAWPGKDISIIQPPGTEGVKSILVFEGFFDFLSLLVWHGLKAPTLPTVVMNSVQMRGRVMETIRSQGIEAVYLYLDRDEAGRKITAEMQQSLADLHVLDKSGMYDTYKDLNDFLQQQPAQRKQSEMIL